MKGRPVRERKRMDVGGGNSLSSSGTWEGTGDLKIWNLVRKREEQGSVNQVWWPPSKSGLELKTSIL